MLHLIIGDPNVSPAFRAALAAEPTTEPIATEESECETDCYGCGRQFATSLLSFDGYCSACESAMPDPSEAM